MGKGKGQPRTSHFVRFTIAYKVVQYIKRYNLTPRQAWLKLSEVDEEKEKINPPLFFIKYPFDHKGFSE